MIKVNATKFESVVLFIESVADICPDGASPYPILADGESESLVVTPVDSFVETWEGMCRPVFIGVAEIEDKTTRFIAACFPENMPAETQKCFTDAIGSYLGRRTPAPGSRQWQH